jgi:hypothetical protein
VGDKIMPLSKLEFEIIEGMFHDGLGTFAELILANNLISFTKMSQPAFDLSNSNAKMISAIERLPEESSFRAKFQKEIVNICKAAEVGAIELIKKFEPAELLTLKHVALDFANAKAADLILEFREHPDVAISVKTDKSGKVAIAEGQTRDIEKKWAERYFRVSSVEFQKLITELGFSSIIELKSDYLNVAKLVAHIIIKKFKLIDYQLTDFKNAKSMNIDAVKYTLRQILTFKQGSDGSQVIIFDRSTGQVKWESLLDKIDIDSLDRERITFLPSRPRGGRPIGSEFGIKIDNQTIVSFQIKHKRGAARGSSRQYEFGDITTRLRV